jgi:hypothetical protein
VQLCLLCQPLPLLLLLLLLPPWFQGTTSTATLLLTGTRPGTGCGMRTWAGSLTRASPTHGERASVT